MNSIGHINKELEIFVRAVMWRNPVRNAGSWPGTPTTMGTLIILTLEQFFRRRFNINRCCPVVVIIMNNHSNILTFLDCIEGFKSQRDTSSCFMFYCTYLHIMNYELYEYYIGYKGDVYKWLKYLSAIFCFLAKQCNEILNNVEKWNRAAKGMTWSP